MSGRIVVARPDPGRDTRVVYVNGAPVFAGTAAEAAEVVAFLADRDEETT